MILFLLAFGLLTGCGSSVSDQAVAPSTFGNLGADGVAAPVDSGYLEAVQMGDVQNAEVETKTGLTLPNDALVFTVIENKGSSTYGFTFYSQMADFALKSYLDEQFIAQGYSQKRGWMNLGGGSVETILYSKGQSLVNIAVDDRGAHRFVDVAIQD